MFSDHCGWRVAHSASRRIGWKFSWYPKLTRPSDSDPRRARSQGNLDTLGQRRSDLSRTGGRYSAAGDLASTNGG
jgi:hypothetical protein